MNDRYLYKAKRKHDSKFFKKCEWVEGACYIEPYTDKCFIIQWNSTGLGFNEFIEVDEESVCQCTGLKDKNGKLIWENDVTYMRCNGLSGYGNVIYENGCFWIYDKKRGRKYPFSNHDVKYRVDGNIFDNTELLSE